MNITSTSPAAIVTGPEGGQIGHLLLRGPNANSFAWWYSSLDSCFSPMRRRVDGWWFIEVQLTHGHHPLSILVDDKPVFGPMGTGMPATSAEQVSLLAVS